MKTNLTPQEIIVLKAIVRSDYMNVDLTTNDPIGKKIPRYSVLEKIGHIPDLNFTEVCTDLVEKNLIITNGYLIQLTEKGWKTINEFLTDEYKTATGKI